MTKEELVKAVRDAEDKLMLAESEAKCAQTSDLGYADIECDPFVALARKDLAKAKADLAAFKD